MPMLEVSRLSVQFGQKKIVDGLSFTVEEGQWLMIVGPKNAAQAVYDYYHNEKSDDTCE